MIKFPSDSGSIYSDEMRNDFAFLRTHNRPFVVHGLGNSVPLGSYSIGYTFFAARANCEESAMILGKPDFRGPEMLAALPPSLKLWRDRRPASPESDDAFFGFYPGRRLLCRLALGYHVSPLRGWRNEDEHENQNQNEHEDGEIELGARSDLNLL